MGSRLGRYAALATIAGLAGCTAGAPPGFSGGTGTQWTLPLVGPLEDGLLLVPALVNGKGPYVFAIDTDARVSTIDQDVMQDIAPRTGEGPKLLDESDTERDRFYAEILEWQLGSLSVKNKPAQIVPAHTFDTEGRRIHGIIGRDILADSLTFSFDRDRGLIMLQTAATFRPATPATRVSFSTVASQIGNAEVAPLSRKLVDATIDGARFAMHLDFGGVASQLRARAWDKAKLAVSALDGAVVDEVGTPRKVGKQGIAASVTVGAATTASVPFIPYEDRRWRDGDLEGTIGLGFFKPFSVAVDWDHSVMYLRERHGLTDTLARIGRWQSKTLTSCTNVGCVKTTLIDPTQQMAPEQRPATHPGLVASIVREPATLTNDLEVLLAATPADGKPPLKWLLVNLPAGVERAMTHLSPDYIGATLTVVDASPFPRECPAKGACVDLLPAPQTFTPPAPGTPQNVPPSAVTLRTGEKMITPSDKSGLFGQRLQAAVKVCADETGKVTGATLVQPSGLERYDRDIVAEITAHWSYEPFVVNGAPTPFCTAVMFIYTQR